MSAAKSHLLICSCEKTMPLDAQAIGRGCAATPTQANQLCGLELERFKTALADGAPRVFGIPFRLRGYVKGGTKVFHHHN